VVVEEVIGEMLLGAAIMEADSPFCIIAKVRGPTIPLGAARPAGSTLVTEEELKVMAAGKYAKYYYLVVLIALTELIRHSGMGFYNSIFAVNKNKILVAQQAGGVDIFRTSCGME